MYKSYIELSSHQLWQSAVERVMQTESDVTVSAALLLALGLAHFAQEENDSSQAAVSPVLFTSTYLLVYLSTSNT